MSETEKEEATEVVEEAEVVEEEPVEETETAEKPKPVDELKVVIILKADKIMIGVQSPDCDPVYTTLTGTLPAALKRVPKVVAEAKEKWGASPRNPEANLPTPEPRPTTVRSTSKEADKPKAQPSFF